MMYQTKKSSMPSGDFVEMARCAVQAPSGHNTQPWKFRFRENTIAILPDADLALPIVDPRNRELFVSLGCATENLCIAATHFRYACEVLRQNEQGTTLQLTREDTVVPDPMFFQIDKRQTNRSLYESRPVAEDVLQEMIRSCLRPQVGCYPFAVGTPVARLLTRDILQGNEIQLGDNAFKKELLSWIRFNRQHVRCTRDGLTYQVFGNPPLPGFLGSTVVRWFLKPGRQNRSDLRKIESSSHLVLFATRHDTPEEWIAAGRSLQRFLLQASHAGIACAYMNQPCEVESLACKMQEQLPVDNQFPLLILRIGYGRPMPYSPRREMKIVCE